MAVAVDAERLDAEHDFDAAPSPLVDEWTWRFRRPPVPQLIVGFRAPRSSALRTVLRSWSGARTDEHSSQRGVVRRLRARGLPPRHGKAALAAPLIWPQRRAEPGQAFARREPLTRPDDSRRLSQARPGRHSSRPTTRIVKPTLGWHLPGAITLVVARVAEGRHRNRRESA